MPQGNRCGVLGDRTSGSGAEWPDNVLLPLPQTWGPHLSTWEARLSRGRSGGAIAISLGTAVRGLANAIPWSAWRIMTPPCTCRTHHVFAPPPHVLSGAVTPAGIAHPVGYAQFDEAGSYRVDAPFIPSLGD